MRWQTDSQVEASQLTQVPDLQSTCVSFGHTIIIIIIIIIIITISVSYTDLWKSIYMIRTLCLNKDD